MGKKIREVEIHGCVATSKTVEKFAEDFIAWIESRKESFSGSYKEFIETDEQDEVVISRKQLEEIVNQPNPLSPEFVGQYRAKYGESELAKKLLRESKHGIK